MVLKFRLKDRQHYWVRLKNSFVFVVNEEGYDAGRAALGLDLCCFSLPSCLFPDAALSEEEVMSKLTGEVIHGILLSLPEFIDMPIVSCLPGQG